MKENKDLNDNELIALLPEDEENIKNIIYEKYQSLIDLIIKKYNNLIKACQIDIEEVKCEALYGFSDGINSYKPNKEASLKTFLSLCIERRVTKYLSKYTTNKYRLLNDTLSLDYVYDNDLVLIDTISDDNKFEPLNNLTYVETFEELISKAKETLSNNEYEVFTYMLNSYNYQDIAKKMNKTPKQIDNTIQRIKIKLKNII